VRSLDELLSISEIRLVVIATPNETHYSFARQCLEAGRDVVVDKTVYNNSRRGCFAGAVCEGRESPAHRLSETAAMTAIFRPFESLSRTETLGPHRPVRNKLTTASARNSSRAPGVRPRAPGSGILFDIAPHLIDHALVLFGLPEAVTSGERSNGT